MKFSLCYTSRRAQAMAQVINTWVARAERPEDVEVVLSVDADYEVGLAEARKLPAVKLALNSGPFNCVAGWNTAAAQATGDVLVATADDFLPPEKWDTELRNLGEEWWLQDKVVWVADGYNPDLLTLAILTRRRYQRFGYLFYPGYSSLFCVPGETLVYMANQSFKPIREIVPGDVVVGSKRRKGRFGLKGQTREFLHPSRVLEVHRKRDALVKLTLESGKTVRCTEDHVWAYYLDPRRYAKNENGKFIRLHRLKEGDAKQTRVRRTNRELEALGSAGIPRRPVGLFGYDIPRLGRHLVKVLDMPPAPPTDSESVRLLGWLAGMYDGEGCFPCITQSVDHNPEVCLELERALRKLNFQFSTDSSYVNYKGTPTEQKVFNLVGGRAEYLKFLAWTRPVRVFKRQVTERMFTSRYGTPDRIVNIEPDGEAEVFCLSTETKNYVADGYLSHNSDTEFTYVAKSEPGSIIDARHLMFEHIHPDCGKRHRDAVDLAHASSQRWKQGEMLFNFRRESGFPLDLGPVAERLEPTYQDLKFAAYVQAIRDDFCLYEVIERLLQEVKGAVPEVFIMSPDEYWGGKPQTPEGLQELLVIQQRLQQAWPEIRIHFRPQSVAPHRINNRSRIMVETAVRNAAVEQIRREGFEHILILDGDELWQPGLFARLIPFIQEFRPASVYTGMIPVAGLPGYPIDGATDKATIYIGPGSWFVDCRGVSGHRHELVSNDVIHFTATRRTREEIAQKMLESGHADDPSYDFKAWNEHVLPNIRPGFTHRFSPTSVGLHMWLPTNVWPRCRAWRPDEWATLPVTVKPYLAAP